MNKVPPIEFRPMYGLLTMGQQIAARFGLLHIWEGEEGLGAVAREKLKELGIPETPVPLTGQKEMTPREVAEHVGFIKKRKRLKRA